MLMIFAPAVSYAASPAGWTATAADTVMAGATATITAFKGSGSNAMKAVIAHKPTAVAVGKEIVKGGGALALAYAMSKLLDAGVDWVLDPANNRVKYTPVATSSDPKNEVFLLNGSCSNAFATPQAACDSIKTQPLNYVGKLSDGRKQYYCGSKSYDNRVFGNSASACGIPVPSTTEKYIPISDVAAQLVANAEAGHADSQDFVKAVAVGQANAGDLDTALEAVSEPTTDTQDPDAPPKDETKPFDDTGILGALDAIKAAIAGVLAAITGLTEFLNSEPPPDKPAEQVPIEPPTPPTKSAADFDIDYVNFGSQCPSLPAFSISIMSINVPMQFDTSPLCDLAVAIRPAIVGMGYFIGIGLVAHAIRES